MTERAEQPGAAQRLAWVQARIRQAAVRAGRDPAGVRLVAVTKGRSLREAAALIALGVRDLGENRPQELAARRRRLTDAALVWHFIGRLQRNKVRRVLRACHWLHSLDRWSLAEAIEARREERDEPLPALVQVNASGEAGKAGVAPQDVNEFLTAVADLRGIAVRGLMTMAPHVADPAAVRPVFRELRELRDRLARRLPPGVALDELSMGMTNDYAVAVEEGATMVRIGRALFTSGGTA